MSRFMVAMGDLETAIDDLHHLQNDADWHETIQPWLDQQHTLQQEFDALNHNLHAVLNYKHRQRQPTLD
jgi:hypothetical protein